MRIKRTLKSSDKIEIVFATASPRRRVLAYKIKYMESGLIVPRFISADVCETENGDAEAVSRENAKRKGEWAAERTKSPVLAFDTVVAADGKVFGKPNSREQAVYMFKTLCGRTHEVITSVYFRVKGKIIEKNQKTSVTFGAFDGDLVYNYVESGAPYDKAGGYNIDDDSIKPLIVGIDGDYDNVVGLPVILTEKLIEEYLLYGETGYSS